jgi:hypothetical protein
MRDEGAPDGRTRREVLRDAGGMTIAVLAGSALSGGGVAVAVERGRRAFLTAGELRTLRALVDVFIPADQDGGAVEGGCAEAIDALLGAFTFSPPRIYAGAPFSDRSGSPRNHFAEFLALDRYERRAWRLRIEGSRGRRSLERNGPVEGWQATYRAGLAALAREGFADRPAPARETLLRTSSDPAVTRLVDVAWPHTWELMYGAPEYGGNRDLIGWRYSVWDGDVLPRGWTREQVEAGPVPGSTAVLENAPLPVDQLLALSALGASPELIHNVQVRTAGSAGALRDDIAPALRGTGGSAAPGGARGISGGR